MNRIMRGVAFATMVTGVALSTTASYGWNYFAQADDGALDEVSTGSETLTAGTIISYLPNGAKSVIVERTQYFVSGGNWFLPIVNQEGIRYQVVFAPM
jgi:hypothetical protein